MTVLQLSLVLVASIWAAMNTLIAGYRAVNGTRDRVVTGCTDEGVPLTFAGFVLFLPELADQPERMRPDE